MNRPLVFPTGNDSFPNRPMAIPPGTAGGGIGNDAFALAQRTYDRTRFLEFLTEADVLAQDATIVLLQEPPNTRGFLIIRNGFTSVGSLAIGFGLAPSVIDNAAILLAPGQSAWFENVIPQNRIYGTAYNGQCRYIITYSNIGSI